MTTVSNPPQETLYDRLRSKNSTLIDKNPLDIIYEQAGDVDLPSYDLLFERFVNGDWGKTQKPRSPLAIS